MNSCVVALVDSVEFTSHRETGRGTKTLTNATGNSMRTSLLSSLKTVKLKEHFVTLKNSCGYLFENFFNSSETGCKLLSIGMQMESTFVNKLRNKIWKGKKWRLLGNSVNDSQNTTLNLRNENADVLEAPHPLMMHAKHQYCQPGTTTSL